MEQTANEILQLLESNLYVLESEVLVREIKVTLSIESLNPTVGIKIWLEQTIDGPTYTYTLSHYFKTPTQAGAYVPGSRTHSTEKATLQAALSALTMHYPEAILKKHEPDESWLIPNQYY
ncbi:hypothetical protein BLL42_11375 [Pseudomonas frederiksbergensis]|uniref:Uncharacterized protein n=1 Tax=Pseudomonas frederiksbergensis TaxID=104087 RepID=A0A1J0EK58_9PSED|nr:hypothetical protein [Pseudomonas frederiksbergensis]APC16299.1 hypothetical protein BLL42_11375 [Pseudomonas frederiksbergensis]